jgi:hypothetical protein
MSRGCCCALELVPAQRVEPLELPLDPELELPVDPELLPEPELPLDRSPGCGEVHPEVAVTASASVRKTAGWRMMRLGDTCMVTPLGCA